MKQLAMAGAGLLAVLCAAVPAAAQDVAEFTRADAAALLDDEGADPAAVDPSAPPPNRAWSFGTTRPAVRPAPPAAGPGQASTGLAVTRRPAAGPATAITAPRPAAPRKLLPLQFGLASADLSAQSRANLQNLADVLLEPRHLEKRVRIIGHADKSGSPQINQALSEQRAAAAVAYLERIGINPIRLESIGVSSDDPLPNMSEFDPRNRRVEIERVR